MDILIKIMILAHSGTREASGRRGGCIRNLRLRKVNYEDGQLSKIRPYKTVRGLDCGQDFDGRIRGIDAHYYNMRVSCSTKLPGPYGRFPWKFRTAFEMTDKNLMPNSAKTPTSRQHHTDSCMLFVQPDLVMDGSSSCRSTLANAP
jgi:hypothetical protein